MPLRPINDRDAMTICYRVQDADGRGPWRPGFSHTWIDESAPPGRLQETIFDLVPLDRIRHFARDQHVGSACRTLDAIGDWFTATERARLAARGYQLVRLAADLVIAESHWQMIIGRTRPFSEGATRLGWDRLAGQFEAVTKAKGANR
jgi:hypothetical protein